MMGCVRVWTFYEDEHPYLCRISSPHIMTSVFINGLSAASEDIWHCFPSRSILMIPKARKAQMGKCSSGISNQTGFFSIPLQPIISSKVLLPLSVTAPSGPWSGLSGNNRQAITAGIFHRNSWPCLKCDFSSSSLMPIRAVYLHQNYVLACVFVLDMRWAIAKLCPSHRGHA